MSETANHYVTTQGLCFKRGDKVIFDDVNLQIQQGKITAIMGPSGTGKTTLLRMIAGQLKPDAGSVQVNGIQVNQLSRKGLYRLRKDMGMLFQSSALFTDLSVFENVAYPLREHTDLPESMIRDIVLMKLESVGLRGASQLLPRYLSGGMARRVALARAVALDPSLIMYDEPFTGQDPITMGVLVRLIKLFNDALGLTSIIVSHDVAETLSIADYVYVLVGGKIISQGSPDQLRECHTPAVKQFIEGLPDGPVPYHYPADDYAKALGL